MLDEPRISKKRLGLASVEFEKKKHIQLLVWLGKAGSAIG
jgi:hypothetical protein